MRKPEMPTFAVRIYYAKTPAVDSRFKDRIEAQAAYFGLTTDQAIQVGKMDREYTQQDRAQKGSGRKAAGCSGYG